MRLIIARMGDGWGIILGMYNLYPPPAIFSGGGIRRVFATYPRFCRITYIMEAISPAIN